MFDEWEEDEPNYALEGCVEGIYMTDCTELDDLLLEMTGDALRALILLRETDERQFKAVQVRLGVLRDLISQFPEKAGHSSHIPRPIGFHLEKTPRSRAKPKAKPKVKPRK